MNENRAEGAAKVVTGKFERVVGGVFGDEKMQVRGGFREGAGHVQEAAGSHDIARTIENRPFVAVTVAAAMGLLAGLLIAGRGPKIVYVKPRA